MSETKGKTKSLRGNDGKVSSNPRAKYNAMNGRNGYDARISGGVRTNPRDPVVRTAQRDGATVKRENIIFDAAGKKYAREFEANKKHSGKSGKY